MTPGRWQRIEQLVQAALECEPAARAALLERECASDQELRAEVESLLASAQPAEKFLESNILKDATGLFKEIDAPGSLIGRQIGPYSVHEQIGSGGMGEVYLAQDVRLGRKVALKLLDPHLIGDTKTRARFFREARLAASLDHPNICTVHEVGEAEGRPYIAMQFIQGQTLRQLIGGRPLELHALLSIGLQVGDALAAAHVRGIIHRDIKPANIIVTAQGQPKVLDFGIAKLLEQEEDEAATHLTMTGAVMGTPASMSPEQARGERVDHRTDIFSFGVMLYELATGRIPFHGRSKADVISALLNEPHVPAAEFNTKIPARLSEVIDKALQKEPAERYQSMSEMAQDLRQVVAEAGGLDHLFQSSAVPLGVMPHVSLRRRTFLSGWITRPAGLALLIVMAAALVGVSFLVFHSWSRREPSAAQSVPTQPPIKSIAVLPFKPLVVGDRDEVLELGMADTLINKLSGMHAIVVRPISAVRKYNNLEQDAVAAGREQKVDMILDGSIQKSADKVRVSVRLMQVADGQQLWSESFDEKFTDIFDLQDRVSEKVVGLLALKLTGQEQILLTKRYTEDSEAYELYLKGRYQLNRLTDDGFRKGRDYFQDAIEKDPGYALAYAGLANAYNMLGGFNVLPPKEVYPKAREAATKALELDESLSEAHAALGDVAISYDWDFPAAEQRFRRALEINPSNSDAHKINGFYLSAMGRFDEALKEMKHAQQLNPLSLELIAGIGEVLYVQRQYDQATDQYQRALEMDVNSGFAYWALGRTFTAKGRYNEAIETLQKSIPLSGDSPDERAELARTYALAGRRDEALKVLNELKQLSERKHVSPTVIAAIYGALGDKDQAFAWLNKAFETRDFILVLLKVEPMFDPLRDDPRFTALMKRVGLQT
jgi:serine/threonine protein kinase/TolB-like protein/Tfp pilus assembly protein PilF